jgi:hypothetical protein
MKIMDLATPMTVNRESKLSAQDANRSLKSGSENEIGYFCISRY